MNSKQTMTEEDLVECCRCKNKHLKSERIEAHRKGSDFVSIVCPRCGAESYYNLSERERVESKTTQQYESETR
jgi:RNase P subunit RPR2